MKKILQVLITIILFTLPMNNYIMADETEKESKGGFSFKTHYPSSQTNDDLGYYDLLLKPGQEETLVITFSNSGATDVTVETNLNTAKTNSNGVVEYGGYTTKNDASLKYDFVDHVTGPKTIDLKAGETKDYTLKVLMPKTSYVGSIVGALQVKEANQKDKEENKGAMVINEYAYVVPIVLKNSEDKVKPKLKMNKAYPDSFSSKNSVVVNYSNTEATFVNNMSTEVQITSKESDEVLFETKKKDMRMAPNTYIEFITSMNGEEMVPGDYRAHVLVTADGGIKEQWVENFKITKEDADKFNTLDAGLTQKKGIDIKLILGIVAIILVVMIVIFAGVTFYNKKKEEKKKEQKKKKRKNR